ncbi:MAG TPA: Uma2 family endonuclease [Verrucomicrobiae bacterium]|nr:Uma2 family endonuclease [Verrucomicrobiae bacterium]
MPVTLELPPQKSQAEFNLRRWAELLVDPLASKFEGRVETDRFGHMVMSPPPAPSHGSYQAEIAYLLRQLLPQGRVITECAISTADGVKAADVAWASLPQMKALGSNPCFLTAPEICVEVQSPSNTEAEFSMKRSLYFDAGAREVWVCSDNGDMSFFGHSESRLPHSVVCSGFPKKVKLGA